MVGGYPHVALLILRHITNHHLRPWISRHIHAESGKIALRSDKPLLQRLVIYIDAQVGIHPIIILAIYEGKDRPVGGEFVVADKAVHPHHLLSITIQLADDTVIKGNHRLAIVFTDATHLIIRKRAA